MTNLYAANVVGENLIDADIPVEGDPTPLLLEEGVIVVYGDRETGIRAVVLAYDLDDAERRILATFGDDAYIDDLQLTAPVPDPVAQGLRNLSHAGQSCSDPDCEIHQPWAYEGAGKYTALAWYEAGRRSVVIQLELDTEEPTAARLLAERHGPNPQDVGKEEGTEDDFGDLIHDAVQALGRDPDTLSGEEWSRVQDAAAESVATTMPDFLDDLQEALK